VRIDLIFKLEHGKDEAKCGNKAYLIAYLIWVAVGVKDWEGRG
jgi:hypothetical protein